MLCTYGIQAGLVSSIDWIKFYKFLNIAYLLNKYNFFEQFFIGKAGAILKLNLLYLYH